MNETFAKSGSLSFSVASPDQQECIEGVLRDAFDPYVRKLGRALTGDAFAWLGPALQSGTVYIGLDNGVIVGVVATSCHGHELAIDQMAVRSERQGAGIGSWLLAEIDEVARAHGFEAISLDTAAMMNDLLRLYRQHGFEESRRGPPVHGKDTHQRVYLTKVLR